MAIYKAATATLDEDDEKQRHRYRKGGIGEENGYALIENLGKGSKRNRDRFSHLKCANKKWRT